MPTEHVILVTASDRRIGTLEKWEAHTRGVLHRAISVMVMNQKGEMLLQRRAKGKYHSAHPSNYAAWFPLVFDQIRLHCAKNHQ